MCVCVYKLLLTSYVRRHFRLWIGRTLLVIDISMIILVMWIIIYINGQLDHLDSCRCSWFTSSLKLYVPWCRIFRMRLPYVNSLKFRCIYVSLSGEGGGGGVQLFFVFVSVSIICVCVCVCACVRACVCVCVYLAGWLASMRTRARASVRLCLSKSLMTASLYRMISS